MWGSSQLRAQTQSGEINRSLAQGLGRNAGRAHCDTAGADAPIDERDMLSEVRCLRGALLAGRARADHDQIVLRAHSAVSPGLSALSRKRTRSRPRGILEQGATPAGSTHLLQLTLTGVGSLRRQS